MSDAAPLRDGEYNDAAGAKGLPWNQVAMGAFAWVELREIDHTGAR